jgi:hypothetical protein
MSRRTSSAMPQMTRSRRAGRYSFCRNLQNRLELLDEESVYMEKHFDLRVAIDQIGAELVDCAAGCAGIHRSQGRECCRAV